MADYSIAKEDWASFLEWITAGLFDARAEIDVLALDIGAQVEARALPLLGLAYDHKNDLIEVALDGLDHLIRHPREVSAHEEEDGLWTIKVVDKDDVTQIIKLMGPLNLPVRVAQPWRREPAKDRMGKHT
jgi:hypothetical protein